MQKIDKNLISTYLALNNKKADEYLAKVANEILKDLEGIDDNDQIIELLDILAEFVYKVPNQAIDIIKFVISHPLNPKIIKSPFGEYEDKNYIDVVIKALEVLDRIRYIHPDGVLPLLARFTLNDKKEISTKAQEVLKHFAKYDFNVLTKSKIGYGAQRKALDFVLAWRRDEQLQHIDFVETVLKELLSSSVEGTTSGLNKESQYTLTMHSGVVSPTDFLKKMRRETIDLVYELYQAAKDSKTKLKLVEILFTAVQTPSNVAYGDDVAQMIVDDSEYLASIFRKIVFGEKKNKMTDYLSIAATIEERLYWINRNEKRQIEETKKLRQDILRDNLYKIFRLLAGDPIAYRDEEGWNTAEAKRDEEINQLIDSVEISRIKEWFERLNKIASQHILVDDWKFNPFNGFLQKLSEVKPEIADNLLEVSFKVDSPLKHFIGSFLNGFRVGAHFKCWDKYTDKIINSKNVELINALIYSLNIYGEVDLKKYIRSDDLKLLKRIVKKQAGFSFLKKTDHPTLHHALVNTLTRNYKRDPKLIESLVVKEIKNNPKYLSMFFRQLPFIFHRGWMNVGELQSETIDLLKKAIVELSDVDYHIQEMLIDIGKIHGLNAVLDVFLARIKQDAKKKKKIMKSRREDQYEPIPYHFNPALIKFIAEDPGFEKTATEWLIKMTTDWSTYNHYVSRFLEKIGKGFDKIIGSLIQKGDNDSLMKAARAMHSIEGTNLDLCIEIVRRTDNKRILGQVASNIYTTGVVMGEYGLAQAYENKAKELEKYKDDKSKRVKIFVDRMIKSLMDSAKRERQRTDEEKQLRKIEFEG